RWAAGGCACIRSAAGRRARPSSRAPAHGSALRCARSCARSTRGIRSVASCCGRPNRTWRRYGEALPTVASVCCFSTASSASHPCTESCAANRPAFFEGDASAFTGLRFNVEDESFEFYGPAKMRDDPRWVDVSRLFIEGLSPFIAEFSPFADKLPVYLERLNRLKNLENREFHEEKITGQDKNVDIVVDIFNRVNSGGTALSKGDLALAKLCAQWSPARQIMRGHLERWQQAGFEF